MDKVKRAEEVFKEICADEETSENIEKQEYIGPIELENGSYYEIVKEDGHLMAGTVCNTGLLPHYKQKLDEDFSMDENLQSFIANIELYEYNKSNDDDLIVIREFECDSY